MSQPVSGWLLLGLAVCGSCDRPLTAQTGGRNRRFYICACATLRDASVLDDTVAAAAADRHWRTGIDGLRPYAVLCFWAQASHEVRHRYLRRFLYRVVVDSAGAPTYHWLNQQAHHPDPPAAAPPTGITQPPNLLRAWRSVTTRPAAEPGLRPAGWG